MKFFLVFFSAFIIASFTWGQTSLSMHRPMSYRQMGMGGAFTAIADDYYLIFHNPAGLSANKKKFSKRKEKTGLWNIGLIGFGSTESGIRTVADILQSVSAGNPIVSSGSNDQETTQNWIDFLDQYNRSSLGLYVNLPLSFGYTGYKFGINFFADFDFEATPYFDSTQLDADIDLKFNFHTMIGFSLFKFKVLNKDLFLGGAVRLSALGSLDGIFGAETLTDISTEDFINQNTVGGFAIGLDWGAIWHLDHGIRVGLTLHDLPTIFFEYDFIEGRIRTDRYDVFPNIDAGVAYSFPFLQGKLPSWLLTDMLAAFDFQRLIDPNVSLGTSMKLGATFNLFDFKLFLLNFSVGFNGGFNNFNASTTIVLLKFLRLHAGYFNKSEGKYAYTLTENRILFDVSFRW